MSRVKFHKMKKTGPDLRKSLWLS